jgi:hypothetical protein
LEEVGFAGEAVGEEVLAEVGEEVLAGAGEEAGLVGVTPISGGGLGMACLTVILTGDTNLLTPTMVTVQHCPTGATHGKGI